MSQKINLDTSMGEFVAKYPQSIDVFNSFDLDYCCGGQKNISIAAKEKNIDLEEFEALLKKVIEKSASTEKNKSWANESLSNIVNHIQKVHHVFAWEKLHSIKILLDKLVEVHTEKHGDFLIRLETIFVDFKDKLEKHLRTEETVLFPFVRKLDRGGPINDSNFTVEMIDVLQKEHAEAGELLGKIKGFTSHYALPDYACASFAKLYADLESLEDDLHEHINLENAVLFPRVKELMD